MKPYRILNSPKMTILLLFFTINNTTMLSTLKAQQDNRDKFLVDQISRYDSPSNYASAEYIYDVDNKLLKRIITGKMVENSQLRDLKYVDIFEYEYNRVSKIHYYDSTHFMFSHDIHFLYNSQGKLIRKETWMNGSMIGSINYHYENGLVVSIYNDKTLPFETDTLIYDNSGNVSKHIEIYPKFDMIGQPIPGEFEVRESYYEYDSNPTPNFGLDYLFAFQLIPWLGTAYPSEIRLLSNNNMTKAAFQLCTYNYTYNEHGLPETLHDIFDPIGALPGRLLTITYKQIEKVNISEVTQIAEISIYPNPAKDKIMVDCEYLGTIKLYDMIGKEVLSKNAIGKTDVEISHLPKGVYNVIILSESNIIRKGKIIKQ